MKNVIVVLLLLAAALGAYWLIVARGSGEELPNSVGTRPVVPLESRRPELPGAAPAPELPLQRDTPWRGAISPDIVVPYEEARHLDLSSVDFAANVLCTVNGEQITREDYERRAVIQYGQPALRARLIHLMGKRIAAETNQPFGLSDEEFELYLKTYGESRQTDVEGAKLLIAQAQQLPVETSLRLRREIVEGVLALYPPIEDASELPVEVRATVPGTEDLARMVLLAGAFAKGRAEPSGTDFRNSFFSSMELGIILAQQTFALDLFQRGWTSMDHELPAGVVAAYAMGPLPLNEDGTQQVTPPWSLAGEAVHVPTSDLFATISEGLTRRTQESLLEELIWSTAVRQELAAAGTLPSPEQGWLDYAEEYHAGRKALLSSRTLVDLEGHESEQEYIEIQRYRAGYSDSRPAGWDEPDALRAFFEANRYLVQAWLPDITIAVFPPEGDAGPVGANSAWAHAEAAARAFCERVSAAPATFDAAVGDHLASLEQSSEQDQDAVLRMYRVKLATGRISRPPSEVDELFGEEPSDQDLRGTNLLRNAVARLERGEISPPWRTPIGYVVVRMNDARLARLEQEYEDAELATEQEHLRSQFRKWASGVLGAAVVELP